MAFFVEAGKVTTGVYKYEFVIPKTTKPDWRGKTRTYVGFATCGSTPQVVYDALHPAHGKLCEDPNVMVFTSEGQTDTVRLSRLMEFIRDERESLY